MEKQGSPESEPVAGYLVKHTETGECFDISASGYDYDDESGLAGIYEHYKSTADDPKFYEVEHVVRCSQTGESLVIYRPLYETGEVLPAARPAGMFVENIQSNGYNGPRFRLVRREV